MVRPKMPRLSGISYLSRYDDVSIVVRFIRLKRAYAACPAVAVSLAEDCGKRLFMDGNYLATLGI